MAVVAVRLIWLLAAAAIFAVGTAPASAGEPPNCEQLLNAFPTDPLHDWIDTRRERIAALLQPEDRDGYEAAIAADRCEDAEAIVAKRFRAAFPEMACFFGPPMGRVADPASAWRIYIAMNVFADVSLCFAEKELKESLATLNAAGVTPPPVVFSRDLKQSERRYGRLWTAVLGVDNGVIVIDGDCRFQRRQKACVAFARIANEGKLLRKSDELIYFLVVRARLAGVDTPERRRLEEEVGARLQPEARGRTESLARASLAGEDIDFRAALPKDRYPGVPPESGLDAGDGKD
jgi:hypothetical protein